MVSSTILISHAQTDLPSHLLYFKPIMKRLISTSLNLSSAMVLLISMRSYHALAPTSPSAVVRPPAESFVTRRSAAFTIMSSVFVIPASSRAIDEATDVEKEDAEAAKERMRQRIADSKRKYRKSSDLVKQRKDTTDYSCVSETGSPCPEGLVPRAVQREIVGVLEKSGIISN